MKLEQKHERIILVIHLLDDGQDLRPHFYGFFYGFMAQQSVPNFLLEQELD